MCCSEIAALDELANHFVDWEVHCRDHHLPNFHWTANMMRFWFSATKLYEQPTDLLFTPS